MSPSGTIRINRVGGTMSVDRGGPEVTVRGLRTVALARLSALGGEGVDL
jgi:hypothetical protein